MNRRMGGQRRGATPTTTPVADGVRIEGGESVNMDVSDTITCRATFFNSFTGQDVTGYTPVWSSSDTNVFTVHSSTGVVTGVGAGTANVIVRDVGTTVTDTQAITVTTPQSAAASIATNVSTLSIATNGTSPLTAQVLDASAQVLSGQTVSWSVPVGTAVTVSADSGDPTHSTIVTAGASAGSATVRATSGAFTADVAVTVTAPSADFPNLPASLANYALYDWILDDVSKLAPSASYNAWRWRATANASKHTIVSCATAGIPTGPQGDNVMRSVYSGNSGQAPFSLVHQPSVSGALYDEFYECIDLCIDPNFTPAADPADGAKYAWWKGSGSPTINHFTAFFGLNGADEYRPKFVTQFSPSTAGVAYQSPNAASISKGVWHKFERYIRFEDPGVSGAGGGEVKLWMDGVLIHHYTTKQLTPTGRTNFGVQRIEYQPTLGTGTWSPTNYFYHARWATFGKLAS